ncbi:gamma-glutamyltransferase family protein [Burkholderia contaminans]|uniref:gamma-glutamyltransferase family protein n=1 Tax=Burkholderia contaminans TaxID=488447 RepID=UPI001CF5C4DA|nr:gamma-glutamyltransferase family protein [Burkholderia contaminans]MCA7915571.1 gamma-glutamyltransferase family protein [Burkholderia contaminans]UUX42231.1 gamma-glutamyltransferase family protein [Burkholderia contaminans]
MRNFEQPGRSLVMSTGAMAATSHPASTLAAVRILEAGGNAMDAAIAACAVQCVVEPGSTGIGGDCFVLYSRGGGDDIVGFNGSGWAPAAASVERLSALGVTSIERHSPHAVTVPGAVDAWATLARDHGSLPLSALLAPAIRFARDGYAVAPRAAADWAHQAQLLSLDATSREQMLVAGHAPRAGSVHRQPLLARTLEAIAQGGPRVFYEGGVAEDIVARLRSMGGLHTMDDFAAFHGEYVTPITARFRGYDVHECPPNGQGVIALLMLKLLEGFDANDDPLGAERLHREIDAARVAYALRDVLLADPRRRPMDVDTLLSEASVESLRTRIAALHALGAPVAAPVEHKDTVYICVVDKDRNCASFINSLFHPFGSGIMSAQTGVMLHNRGQSFTLEAGHPNAIAPHARPMHTIIPGMVTRDGKVQITFGVMGGHYQAMGHAHFLSKVLDYGLDLQTAIDLPRIFPRPGTDQVEVECTMPAAAREALARRGFNLVAPSWAIGGAQAIRIDWEVGTLIGASDHRKDGCALGI